jgi:hypothetical protein
MDLIDTGKLLSRKKKDTGKLLSKKKKRYG